MYKTAYEMGKEAISKKWFTEMVSKGLGTRAFKWNDKGFPEKARKLLYEKSMFDFWHKPNYHGYPKDVKKLLRSSYNQEASKQLKGPQRTNMKNVLKQLLDKIPERAPK